jgi:DNA-binding transcriptional LysR family regulator
MKLQQLRYFEATCRLGSISRAAEALHVSQPSVSMAIRELEREFGVALIARRYQGFSLTEEGASLQEMADSLLRHADHVADQMRALGRQRRPVRLGVPPMIGTVLLPVLYRQLESRYPDLLLATEELGTKTLIHDLRENVLDAAFVSHHTPLPPEFDAVPITAMEVVWCAPRSHPLASLERIRVSQLENEPLAFFQSNFALRELVMECFETAHVTPNILHATEQLSTVQSLIRGGTATGFLLRPLAEAMPDLAALPLDPPLSVQVSLVWKRSQKPFRDLSRLIELCRSSPVL